MLAAGSGSESVGIPLMMSLTLPGTMPSLVAKMSSCASCGIKLAMSLIPAMILDAVPLRKLSRLPPVGPLVDCVNVSASRTSA